MYTFLSVPAGCFEVCLVDLFNCLIIENDYFQILMLLGINMTPENMKKIKKENTKRSSLKT